MPHPSNFWNTNDRVERLKIMHAAEWSLSEMAAELGTTRNAITGKIDRLKLPRGEGRARSADVRRQKQARRAERKIKIPTFPVLPPLPDIPALDKSPAVIEPPRQKDGPVTIFELTSRTCRFPLGSMMERAEFFCGCLPTENLPYCAEHANRCYQPINPRQHRGALNGETRSTSENPQIGRS